MSQEDAKIISEEELVKLLSGSQLDSQIIDHVLDIVLASPDMYGSVFALAASYAPVDPQHPDKPEDMPLLCFRAALELDAATVIAAMLAVPFELNHSPMVLTCDDGHLRLKPFSNAR